MNYGRDLRPPYTRRTTSVGYSRELRLRRHGENAELLTPHVRKNNPGTVDLSPLNRVGHLAIAQQSYAYICADGNKFVTNLYLDYRDLGHE